MRVLILIGFSVTLSCKNHTEKDPLINAEFQYFNAIEENNEPLSVPKEGDWRYDHDEPLQTFEKYKLQNPKTLNDNQYVIYLQPMGDFTELQQSVMTLTKQYLAIFFQTKTVLLPAITDKLIPPNTIRIRENNNIQIPAPYVLDTLLKMNMPKDAIAYMAITAKDLYPQNNWNYVFGLASYTKRVGVSSIYRLQNKVLDSSNFSICLQRLLKVSSHEIGHMFNIHHCTLAKCVMNGSNSLTEIDGSPTRLCSECQKKLSWNIRYNNQKRLKELCNFFSTNQLKKDYKMAEADLISMD